MALNSQFLLTNFKILQKDLIHASANGFLNELVEGLDRAHLGVVLDDGAIGLDDVDGGEGLGVELGLDEFTLLISAELVDINVSLLGELAELLLHSLAELQCQQSIDTYHNQPKESDPSVGPQIKSYDTRKCESSSSIHTTTNHINQTEPNTRS